MSVTVATNPSKPSPPHSKYRQRSVLEIDSKNGIISTLGVFPSRGVGVTSFPQLMERVEPLKRSELPVPGMQHPLEPRLECPRPPPLRLVAWGVEFGCVLPWDVADRVGDKACRGLMLA